jgi:hypothetical protein
MSITASGSTVLQLQTRDKKMPMESQAQRRKLWATNPKVAQEFEDKTPKGKKLPERVGKRMTRKKKT